mgnify:CR=1 FL=1
MIGPLRKFYGLDPNTGKKRTGSSVPGGTLAEARVRARTAVRVGLEATKARELSQRSTPLLRRLLELSSLV